MSATTVARRYAEAMAAVALARNAVEQIENELGAWAEMMRQSRELHDLFASPIMSQADKGKVLDALIARTNAGSFTANLLRTMLTNYRLPLITNVYDQYRRIINERRGIVIAEVTTAQPLSQQEQAQLSRRLQTMTGKQVEFHFKTDASLIGGVVTRIGSVVYDGSVSTQLQGIRQQLKSGARD